MQVEAGPYELVRDEQLGAAGVPFDKVTLCLMSDHTVSERHYSKYGGLTNQRMHKMADLDAALQHLAQLTDSYKAQNYAEAGDAFKPPKSKAVTQLQVLGKRKAE